MPYVVVVMGVSGSGKTTVGRSLARELGVAFVDADDHHSAESIEKMAAGIALDDQDRVPWLARLRGLIEDHIAASASLVLACSAMKQAYRHQLAAGDPAVHFVFLRADHSTIERRLQQRQGHFMKAAMLQSQFAAMEEPADAVVVDADAEPSEIVARVLEGLEVRGIERS